jgi:hypothetical protein
MTPSKPRPFLRLFALVACVGVYQAAVGPAKSTSTMAPVDLNAPQPICTPCGPIPTGAFCPAQPSMSLNSAQQLGSSS